MIINHTRQWVFYEVPRTASRSMRAVLKRLPGSVAFNCHRVVIPDRHRQAATYLAFAGYRNPYARHFSHWAYRYRNPGNHQHNMAADGFAKYVAWACGLVDPKMYDPPATGRLRDVQVFRWVRFEDLPQSWNNLWIFDGQSPPKLPRINRTHQGDWRDAYDQRLADLIFEHDRGDFEKFEYDRESWREEG